jgi:hypothetical protein
MKHGVRVRVLGDLSMLPTEVAAPVARAVNLTKDNTKLDRVSYARSQPLSLSELFGCLSTSFPTIVFSDQFYFFS